MLPMPSETPQTPPATTTTKLTPKTISAQFLSHSTLEEQHVRATLYTSLNSSLNTSAGSNGDETVDSPNELSFNSLFIQKELARREGEFTIKRSLLVRVVTWNVNGKLFKSAGSGSPSEDGLNGLFSGKEELVIVGLQEVDNSAEAFIRSSYSALDSTTAVDDYWSRIILNSLNSASESQKYRKLASKQLVGILIFAFVRTDCVDHVSFVASDSKGTGILGMGNKGASALLLRVYDSYFCFLNSHLAADSSSKEGVNNMLNRRNEDYQEIISSIKFNLGSQGTLSLMDNDVLVWLGDLNYRLELPFDTVFNLLNNTSGQQISRSEVINMLLKHDQLRNNQQINEEAFSDFIEGQITFPPTYKYSIQPQTDGKKVEFEFDEEKKRTPSYTDRILFRKNDLIVCKAYNSFHSVKLSDHKPVYAVLQMKAKQIDKEKYQETYRSVLRNMDKQENEALPDCRVTPSDMLLDFGPIEYGVGAAKTIEVENIGTVVAKIGFLKKESSRRVCEDWCWINPPMAVLSPKEKLTLRFTILVDGLVSQKFYLNEKRNDKRGFRWSSNGIILEDIVILHLENGKDFFVSLSATYRPSCFGMPLSLLVYVQNPVHSSIPLLSDCYNSGTSFSEFFAKEKPLKIPKEIWRLIDYLYHFGLGLDGLFVMPGEENFINTVRHCLDSGTEFPLPSSFIDSENKSGTGGDKHVLFIYSVAETLLRLLDSLPEPVVPYEAFQRCVDSCTNYQLAKAVNLFLMQLIY